ncbi:AAA family ATPase [Lactiplantibacillus herbarum]|uniref:AAA family ATPase n=1 Tax=Lactiplantibacillus herbarum TaxID=1670446 RepID=UPI00064FF309|nr:AAA family ATPase [Lactiplantibacillus herbarum]
MNNIKEVIRRLNMEITESNEQNRVFTFVTYNNSISKQTIIANLAIMYALSGESVLIIDTDFSKNVFVDAFKLKVTYGLSDYLNNWKISRDQIIKKVANQDISVLNSGEKASSDTKYLIGDPRFDSLLNSLKKNYNKILINTPIMTDNSYTDVERVMKLSDGVIVSIEKNTVKKRQMFKFINNLRNNEINLLGYINAKGQ